MTLKKRIEKLEAEPIRINGKTIEEMTCEELEAIVFNGDPVELEIFHSLSTGELQRLADGDQAATADFYAKVKAAKHEDT